MTRGGTVARELGIQMLGVQTLGAVVSAASFMRRYVGSAVSALKTFVDNSKIHATLIITDTRRVCTPNG